MFAIRNSISRKLTVMNLLVGGSALLLACAAFFVYEVVSFRANMIDNLLIQSHIISSNSITPLVFNDPQSAENTLSALRASPHIVYAEIYDANGRFFAGYWRDRTLRREVVPPSAFASEPPWHFTTRGFTLTQPITLDRKTLGAVFIESDLKALTDRLKTYSLILVVILAGSLTATLFISRVSQRAISRPIIRLAETARLVSHDKNYGIRAVSSDDHDELAALVEAFNDMLREIQHHDAVLQESEKQFRMLADSVPQLVWMADAEGRITWYNRRWREYTGAQDTGAQATNAMVPDWESVQDPERRAEVLSKWKESVRSGQPFEMIISLRNASGEYRQFLSLVSPVPDSYGDVVRWFGTHTDVTEQRRSEEALRKTEKLAATGRLAASIAHEINNPLEAVTNLLYLARKHPSNAQSYLAIADHELDRIAEITKHTLGFYRDTSAPAQINISCVFDEILNLYERKLRFKKIAVKTRFEQEVAIVGFIGEIRQIFANLIANAIDALPQNGQLIVKVAYGSDFRDRSRMGAHVSVMDKGSGISPDKMASIFEPFYTTKKDVGTGLGLWLTKGLVEKQHGSIRVRSRASGPRTWTVFSVFLPGISTKMDAGEQVRIQGNTL